MEAAERPFYIYCHTAPNGKRYIGQTCLNPERRWNNGHGYDNCTYMHRAIEKYGWDNFKHEILCVVHTRKVANLFEQHYIAKYDTFNEEHGYNLTEGGAGVVGCAWDEERKRERSKRISGEGNPMYGRHHSEESLKKMSENRSGLPFSEEQRREKTRILLEAVERQKKRVIQYGLDGTAIATYPSLSEAVRVTGSNHSSVWRVCNGEGDVAGGYKWSYEDKALRAKAEQRRAKRIAEKNDRIRRGEPRGGIEIIQIDAIGNEIARYQSLSAAERDTGLRRDRIGDCCFGGLESYGGFTWKFANKGQVGLDSTAVTQFDLNGNCVACFSSLAEASAKTGVPRYQIRNCCRGRTKTSHGFKWEFSDKETQSPAPFVGVIQLDMDGNEIARYKSLSDAMRATGHDRHRIVECCKGERESYRNTRWQYDAA